MTAPFTPAARLGAIGVSEILRITERAHRLRREGRDVIILGAGEPDFDTPDHIKEAAHAAMLAGATKYTALEGTPELKAAVGDKFARDNNIMASSGEVTVASGAKQIIFNAMMASLNPGDEVIIPAPYWVSYPDIVQIAGGAPVIVPCAEADGFRLGPEALERALSPRTRWLMLNSPSNPSGAAHTRQSLRALLDVLVSYPDVWVMADDIYESILYDDREFLTPAGFDEAFAGRTLTVNGVSKAYAMTGWRIGYAAGPAPLIAAMAGVQSQSTSCPSSVSQAAALAALTGAQEFLAERRRSFAARRDLLVDAVGAIPGLSCRRPDGAFYLLVNCSQLIGAQGKDGKVLHSDRDIADYLLSSCGVAVVPGSAFGSAGYLRLSYATSQQELRRACERIGAACDELRH